MASTMPPVTAARYAFITTTSLPARTKCLSFRTGILSDEMTLAEIALVLQRNRTEEKGGG